MSLSPKIKAEAISGHKAERATCIWGQSTASTPKLIHKQNTCCFLRNTS